MIEFTYEKKSLLVKSRLSMYTRCRFITVLSPHSRKFRYKPYVHRAYSMTTMLDEAVPESSKKLIIHHTYIHTKIYNAQHSQACSLNQRRGNLIYHCYQLGYILWYFPLTMNHCISILNTMSWHNVFIWRYSAVKYIVMHIDNSAFHTYGDYCVSD